jgi:hypothetical protein
MLAGYWWGGEVVKLKGLGYVMGCIVVSILVFAEYYLIIMIIRMVLHHFFKFEFPDSLDKFFAFWLPLALTGLWLLSIDFKCTGGSSGEAIESLEWDGRSSGPYSN